MPKSNKKYKDNKESILNEPQVSDISKSSRRYSPMKHMPSCMIMDDKWSHILNDRMNVKKPSIPSTPSKPKASTRLNRDPPYLTAPAKIAGYSDINSFKTPDRASRIQPVKVVSIEKGKENPSKTSIKLLDKMKEECIDLTKDEVVKGKRKFVRINLTSNDDTSINVKDNDAKIERCYSCECSICDYDRYFEFITLKFENHPLMTNATRMHWRSMLVREYNTLKSFFR